MRTQRKFSSNMHIVYATEARVLELNGTLEIIVSNQPQTGTYGALDLYNYPPTPACLDQTFLDVKFQFWKGTTEKCFQLSHLQMQDNVNLLRTSQLTQPPRPLPATLQPITWAGYSLSHILQIPGHKSLTISPFPALDAPTNSAPNNFLIQLPSESNKAQSNTRCRKATGLRTTATEEGCGGLLHCGKTGVKLNGGRHVQGILRGFDPFMNLVIDECVEMATSGQQNNIGMVVIRGNSIIMLEALERV
ncbi:hypothetical protein M91_09610 [Bos mutus]|uniref:Small nuclear ribonucleoprotein G n=2 Tax=Boreoeutheria TaxID=1437010 RepID=L8IQY4_9CETA|nr:hypothetical protein M91_09610 [Bos mutus]